jgi:hypothetical protein
MPWLAADLSPPAPCRSPGALTQDQVRKSRHLVRRPQQSHEERSRGNEHARGGRVPDLHKTNRDVSDPVTRPCPFVGYHSAI